MRRRSFQSMKTLIRKNQPKTAAKAAYTPVRRSALKRRVASGLAAAISLQRESAALKAARDFSATERTCSFPSSLDQYRQDASNHSCSRSPRSMAFFWKLESSASLGMGLSASGRRTAVWPWSFGIGCKPATHFANRDALTEYRRFANWKSASWEISVKTFSVFIGMLKTNNRINTLKYHISGI